MHVKLIERRKGGNGPPQRHPVLLTSAHPPLFPGKARPSVLPATRYSLASPSKSLTSGHHPCIGLLIRASPSQRKGGLRKVRYSGSSQTSALLRDRKSTRLNSSHGYIS